MFSYRFAKWLGFDRNLDVRRQLPSNQSDLSRWNRNFRPGILSLEDRTVPTTLVVTNTLDAGMGSLRDTIGGAMSGEMIVFSNALSGQTISLTGGQISISKNLEIEGLGANHLAVSGGKVGRIFDVTGNSSVTLAKLTLKNGQSTQGGAINNEAGSKLTIRDCTISGNTATADANGDALGGSIFNAVGASLTVDHCLISSNTTNGSNQSFGGAIDNRGALSVDHSSFNGNQAQGSTLNFLSPQGSGSLGGAIENEDGSTLTATTSSFVNNGVQGFGTGDALGGAISDNDVYVYPFTGLGVTTHLTDCTFSGNSATGGSNATYGGFGGAIEDLPGVTLSIVRCTLTNNSANSGGGNFCQGGAMDDSIAVSITIDGSLFVNNQAVGTAILGADAYGGALDSNDTMVITNSTFIGNKALGGDNAGGVVATGQGKGGAIYNQGFGPGTGGNMTIAHCIFSGNEAIGGANGPTTVLARFAAGRGGAIMNHYYGGLNISDCLITGNRAVGGANALGPAALGLGGGIDNSLNSKLTTSHLTMVGNMVQGGAGAAGTIGGNGLGGGIDNFQDSTVTLNNSTVILNTAAGGLGGAGAKGGDGLGAGISTRDRDFLFGIPDAGSLTMTNSTVGANVAHGATGGYGLGGGIFVGGGSAMLQNSHVFFNAALGGVGGQGVGGGVYVFADASACQRNTLINVNFASTDDNDVFGNLVPC
jgi:hypothetical protein